MAGRGPAPKPAAQRRRRNKPEVATKTVSATIAAQPELPDGFDWPSRTVEWWARWAESPLVGGFTSSDWEFLLDTALVHADVWGPKRNLDRASELRLRVAKFGVTPEDRLRLKIEFAEPKPDDGEEAAGVADLNAWRDRAGSAG